MSERVPFGAHVDEEVIARFRRFVEEKTGRTRGEIGRNVERAMLEYMDEAGISRVEANQEEILDTIEDIHDTLVDTEHVHARTTGSPTTERTQEIARRLQNKLEDPEQDVLKENDHVERAITDIAGGDYRTHEKYKRELKERHLAFRHPRQPLWMTNAVKFVEWIENTAPEAVFEARRTYGKDWWNERVQELDLGDEEDASDDIGDEVATGVSDDAE